MAKINTRVRDSYNNLITPGSFITYPSRHRSDMYMRTARVNSISTREVDDGNDNKKLETVLKVTTCIAPRWQDRKNDRNWREKRVLREVTLSEYHRATIIPEHYVRNDDRYNLLLED